MMASLVGAAAPFLALLVGCSSFSFLRSTPKEKPTPKVAREAPAHEDSEPARLPSRFQVRVAPVLFLSDYQLHPDLPLFSELADLRDQIQKDLALPPATETVKVYLFETEKQYRSYLRTEYPELYKLGRRAFFIAQPRPGGEDLLVFTYDSKRIRQDLRHELTHALLHGVIKEVPQWLDEGLAEYYEQPPGQNGVNPEHVQRLRADLASGRARLSLPRLEKLTQVDDMKPPEYRESWAWAHLMLRGKPEARAVLLAYLQQLRGAKHPGPLAPRLEKVYSAPDEALTAHLARLEAELSRQQADAR
jgi:hypothetical protein